MAEAYLSRHDIGRLLSTIVDALVATKPEDPVPFLIESLLCAHGGTMSPQKVGRASAQRTYHTPSARNLYRPPETAVRSSADPEEHLSPSGVEAQVLERRAWLQAVAQSPRLTVGGDDEIAGFVHGLLGKIADEVAVEEGAPAGSGVVEVTEGGSFEKFSARAVAFDAYAASAQHAKYVGGRGELHPTVSNHLWVAYRSFVDKTLLIGRTTTTNFHTFAVARALGVKQPPSGWNGGEAAELLSVRPARLELAISGSRAPSLLTRRL